MCSGLRIWNVLTDGIGPLSGMPARQLHRHSTTWRIHRLPGLPGRCSIHPPAGRSFGCHLPTQMRTRNLLRHRAGSLRRLPQSLFPTDGRQNVVRGMSRLGHDGRHGSQESRRVPAAGLQGRILPERRIVSSSNSHGLLLLSFRIQRTLLRSQHRRLRLTAVLQWRNVSRSRAGLPLLLPARLFRPPVSRRRVELQRHHL